MCMVISAVYNDRQLRGGASGRMSTLQHASSVFFQTLYRCTMYTCIFIINIYIYLIVIIYIHTFFDWQIQSTRILPSLGIPPPQESMAAVDLDQEAEGAV